MAVKAKQVARKPVKKTEENDPVKVVAQPEPEKILLVWKSPARLFKKRDREYFTTIGVIVVLLSVILLFAKEFLLIAVILSLTFVSYVLASVPPPKVEHKITNKGIRTGGKLYRWDVLGRYWFETKWKQESLMVENFGGFPGRLILLFSSEVDKKEIQEHVGARLDKEKPMPTPVDKAAKWLQDKVPLETS